MNILYYLNIIKNQKKPIKFLLSRLLWRSGLCRFFKIYLEDNIVMRFHPSSLSAALWIDSNDRKDDVTFISNYLSPGNIFVDVGANIGELTLVSASKVGDKGKVISIEAHPRVFKYLSENVNLNGFKNIYLYNLAVGNEHGKAFFTDIRSDDQNKIATGKSNIEVEVKPLDEIINSISIGKIDLLKVDVEGYEMFVFQGANKVLTITDCIYFESYEKNFKNYGYSTQDVLLILKEYGFDIYKIDNSYRALISISMDYVSNYCENLIAVKGTYAFSKIEKVLENAKM